MGKAQEGVQQGNSYSAPYRYAETTWADDMEWGAAELFRATGDAKYRDDAVRYAELAATEGWFGPGANRPLPILPVHERRAISGCTNWWTRSSKNMLAGYYRATDRAVRQARPPAILIGSACRSFGARTISWSRSRRSVRFYERMTGDTRYREFSARHRDWLLGRNPWGYSMFTEIPSRRPVPARRAFVRQSRC